MAKKEWKPISEQDRIRAEWVRILQGDPPNRSIFEWPAYLDEPPKHQVQKIIYHVLMSPFYAVGAAAGILLAIFGPILVVVAIIWALKAVWLAV